MLPTFGVGSHLLFRMELDLPAAGLLPRVLIVNAYYTLLLC